MYNSFASRRTDLAEMEYNIHRYVFISVYNPIEMRVVVFHLPKFESFISPWL